MRAEIVMIGTELLLGQNVDTNAAFMARTLADNGIDLYQKTTVGDNLERLTTVLNGALDRADVVLTSGGLGPTEDDLTREAIAAVMGAPLTLREDLLAELKARFERHGRVLGENNKKQAYLPEGAAPLVNPNGTAPGVYAETPRGVIAAMPGVPHELKAMLVDVILPRLRERFGLGGVLHSRVLKVCGVGESRVDEFIGDIMREQANPTVGVLASPDVLRIRLTAKADSVEAANALIAPLEARVRERLPGMVMGADGDTLEGVVDALLADRGWRLAIHETATGGLIAHKLTAAQAGSFAGGLVTPAEAMDGRPGEAAEALREQFSADCGLAIDYDAGAQTTTAVFVTPMRRYEWSTCMPFASKLYPMRTATVCLENVRRALLFQPDISGVGEPEFAGRQ